MRRRNRNQSCEQPFSLPSELLSVRHLRVSLVSGLGPEWSAWYIFYSNVFQVSLRTYFYFLKLFLAYRVMAKSRHLKICEKEAGEAYPTISPPQSTGGGTRKDEGDVELSPSPTLPNPSSSSFFESLAVSFLPLSPSPPLPPWLFPILDIGLPPPPLPPPPPSLPGRHVPSPSLANTTNTTFVGSFAATPPPLSTNPTAPD